MMQLVVLYPQPTDIEKFNADYEVHLQLLHEKTGIPADEKPYSIVRFASSPEGAAPYYQMFTLPFASAEALQEALASPGMQAVAADANRISSGGAPVILVGEKH